MAKTNLTQEDLNRVAANIDTRFSITLANLERARADAAPSFQSFRFAALAARAGGMRLPPRIPSTNDSLVAVEFQPDTTGIAVTVAAEGMLRVRQVRQREARLVSDNGIVDYAFRFDARGQAAFRLSNDQDVVDALLAGFTIEYIS